MEALMLAECPQLWLLGHSGTGARPVLAYVNHSHVSQCHSYPPKFHPCQLIVSMCNYVFEDECS